MNYRNIINLPAWGDKGSGGKLMLIVHLRINVNLCSCKNISRIDVCFFFVIRAQVLFLLGEPNLSSASVILLLGVSFQRYLLVPYSYLQCNPFALRLAAHAFYYCCGPWSYLKLPNDYAKTWSTVVIVIKHMT